MAFGLISTTALLSLGIPPAQASAAVHTAEVATTGASGLSHLFHQNIDRRLFLTLGVAACSGVFWGHMSFRTSTAGPYFPFFGLPARDGTIHPNESGGTGPNQRGRESRICRSARSCRRLLGRDRGGGWGPMVTSTLIGSGHAPRKVIGSVNAAEFFITVAVATTFFIELATAHVEHIAALIIGGLLAAPFGGYIVRYVHPRALMAGVGLLVSALALFQLVRSFG